MSTSPLTNQTRQVNTHLPQISQLLQKLVLSFNTNLLALGVKYTHVHIWSKKSPITTASQQHKHANQISSLNTHTHTIDVSATHTQSGVTPGCRAGTIHAHIHTHLLCKYVHIFGHDLQSCKHLRSHNFCKISSLSRHLSSFCQQRRPEVERRTYLGAEGKGGRQIF